MTDADDGIALATYHWQVSSRHTAPPSRQSQRGVYILHGLSEYAGRYDALAGWLNARGWDVAAHDHRGHGRSKGKRACLQHPDDLVRDAAQRIRAYAEQLGRPPVLLGHSMGGLIAAKLALQNEIPLSGLVLLSPALGLHLNAFTLKLLGLLNAVTPNVRLRHRKMRPQLTHDQIAADTYARDPLVNQGVSPRLAHFIATTGPKVLQAADQLKVRTLLLVAGDDRVVDPAASRAFANAAPPGKIALRWYEQAWHELLHETPKISRGVYADLDAWLAGV